MAKAESQGCCMMCVLSWPRKGDPGFGKVLKEERTSGSWRRNGLYTGRSRVGSERGTPLPALEQKGIRRTHSGLGEKLAF